MTNSKIRAAKSGLRLVKSTGLEGFVHLGARIAVEKRDGLRV
jgi:hypothetical protein